MRVRHSSDRKMQREGHVSPSRHDGNIVLPACRKSVRLKKKMSSNLSDSCRVEKFIAKQVKPNSTTKISTASSYSVRRGSDHGQGDDPTSVIKSKSASKAGNRVVSVVKEETMAKPECRVESSDKVETNARNSSEPHDKEKKTMKTVSRVEFHGKQEMETGSGVESSDKEETITKIVCRVESHDKEESTRKTESSVEMDEKADTTTKTGSKMKSHETAQKMTGSKVESPDKEETMIKTGSRVETHDKSKMKTKADVMTKATSQLDPQKKCEHGHLVCQCGICFRLGNGREMEVSSMRQGWHMCTVCHMGFRDPVMHVNHFLKFHKIVAPPLYKCPICGARVEGNRIMEHMKLHEEKNVFQNHFGSICSPSNAKPSEGATHKTSDASSAISNAVDSSRLMSHIHTRTASKPARERLTEVTSDCVKEQGQDGLRTQSDLANSSQDAQVEYKEVITGSALCHICGGDIENIEFEEHMEKHDKEITLDSDVSDTAHGTLRNTQVQLCHMCGADVTSDVFEQHLEQHQNPPVTSSHEDYAARRRSQMQFPQTFKAMS
ncbi:uncharacterized protein [Haliotis asinina]|uniref:uncharacterized protein n=1 Tax=Haliotis asinina TaxID=109174 RepID=UPI00353186F4